MTGAPAMIRPPTIDIFPASASPRRMANPPPMTQMMPKMKAMSMMTFKAELNPDDKSVDCARSGATFMNDRCIKLLFMFSIYTISFQILFPIEDKMKKSLW